MPNATSDEILASETAISGEFVERRQAAGPAAFERRQFGNTHYGLSPEARELAEAIDSYKLQHRRRFVTYEEMMEVIKKLGYAKTLTS